MTRAITSDGNGRGLEEQLYWLARDSWEPLALEFPQAFSAAWSPSGHTIAFVAAPEQGRSGIARLDSKFDLYLMNSSGSELRPLLQDFQHPFGLSWSPDNRSIAFAATFGTLKRQEGVWMAEVSTGKHRLLAPGTFASPVWSPDGKQIAVIQYADDPAVDQRRLVIINVEEQ